MHTNTGQLRQWREFWCTELYFAPRWIVAALLAVLLLRIFLCAMTPVNTTDLYRHLGFASHLVENPKAFYWLTPADFPNEFWSRFWKEQGYIYPPLALLFFAFFGTLGIGLFWVKLTLTLCDLGSALIIGRNSSWWASLLIFASPVSVWYTSHEGQYESLVNLLIVITVLAAKGSRWKTAGISFMLALQSKQLAILILPYLIFEAYLRNGSERHRAQVGLISGGILALVPFFPFYWWRHDVWLLPLQSQHSIYNPFFWPIVWSHTAMAHFEAGSHSRMIWNSIVTTLPLIVLAVFLARGSFLRKLPQALPIIGFWMLIKSISWAMYWYMNLVSGLTFALWRYRRFMILLLALNWLLTKDMADGIRYSFIHDDPAIRACFQKCIWCCDYRAGN